ncbi:fatty acyl-AMP ligase [Thalassospira marina]|uniref:Uncharacterized protein n=1 Tax=Thalassospira marina TaxID=2048283 RepID=A0A2N3KTJ4_9PROT|nr:fatty acyl-AMP ligase [Thalassospira marina]PKR53862.1 hypothetical protein COO20_12705 [Thalassospira marina]
MLNSVDVRTTETRTVPTMWNLLETYVATKADERAFIFLGPDNVEQEVLTYGALHRLAVAYGKQLRLATQPGDRVILMFPTGLSFIVSFLACHFAGVVPVPMVPLKGQRLRDTVLAIAENCAATVVMTTSEQSEFLKSQLSVLPTYADAGFIGVNVDLECPPATGNDTPHPAQLSELAFIQYTSGSTSVPKGVMVSHANLAANLEMMTIAYENDQYSSYVGWAPLYHDMGLIANVLEPFYLGTLCVLMAPNLFAHRPWLWLKAISDYQAHVSGGPNYAYDLCIERAEEILEMGFDLSSWRVAFNSAEPVRAETLRRFTAAFMPLGFRPQTFYPCFGMAEATLLITGGTRAQVPLIENLSRTGLANGMAIEANDPKDTIEVVGCGQVLQQEDIRIVDPHSTIEKPDGEIGEIWVAGPHIPFEYWNNPVSSKETYQATIAGSIGPRFLRTGDLGFMQAGELYVTGRHKDLIIVRGHNVFPQDLEFIAERAAQGLKRNSGAAFAIEDPSDGQQTLCLVQEVMLSQRYTIDVDDTIKAIRQAIMKETDITVHKIILVQPSSIPKTSSGKIRRAETKKRYIDGTLLVVQAQSSATTRQKATA